MEKRKRNTCQEVFKTFFFFRFKRNLLLNVCAEGMATVYTTRFVGSISGGTSKRKKKKKNQHSTIDF